jgi:predicted Ser/Thr protein kinase/tetratricopeptide (TPR) repeat protein
MLAQARIRDAVRELRSRPRDAWLDLARSDQSERWRQGSGVEAEAYFAELPELLADTEEQLVLICGEIQLRREVGERPTVDEYQERFPSLSEEIALQFDVDRILELGAPELPIVASDDAEKIDTVSLPGYELLKKLGSGAAGVVYQARQVSLGRYVAIKVLPTPTDDPKRLARQHQEAKILARLRHPNVVHVYEVVEHCGNLYLVMEFIDGPTLKDFAGGNPLEPSEAAQLVLTLAEAMQAVHEAGVLHRDLKPSNVLVPCSERIRITDFGLAKLRSGENLLTTENAVLGTPSYMSPEQAVGGAQAAGPATDVYSLGAILYELLTGRPPFLGASVLDTLLLIREQDPVPPRHLQPNVSQDLETICLHCLNKSPQNRYLSAGALTDDLRRFLDGAPILARRTSSVERLVRWCRRNPIVAALTGAVAVLLIAAVAILIAKNAGIRREAAAKDAALVTARQAVDQMLMRVASDKLNNLPLGHPLREALLEDALKFYDGFLAQSASNADIHEEMAAVLNTMGCIQRELGHFDDACESFERSIGLLQSIVAKDPNPPALREKLAATYNALAFTWSINPAENSGTKADAQYRRTLQMYQELERDWPARHQPVSHSFRHLADLAFKRGDRAEAERFWREAITSGEAYLEQHPDNLDARSNLCWACADLSDSILIPMGSGQADAESILKKGLAQVAIMRGQDPGSTQAREVAAFLHYCLAQSSAGSARVDDAIGLFRQGAAEMQALCVEFPWNRQYWELSRYFQRETARVLRNSQRPDAATESMEQMADWLQKTGPKLPDDPVPQTELQNCRTELISLLRTAGRAERAKSLEQASSREVTPPEATHADRSRN